MSRHLPPNSTPLERALASVSARISNISVPTASIWNAQACPVPLLPWLAAAVSVDVWDETWPEAMKRQAISTSLEIHRKKGVGQAVLTALESAGHPDAELIERVDYQRHDGAILRNGRYRRGGPSQWATFRVILNRATTIDLAEQIIKRINHSKRLSCHLTVFDYRRSELRHNGTAIRDGSHTRGLI